LDVIITRNSPLLAEEAANADTADEHHHSTALSPSIIEPLLQFNCWQALRSPFVAVLFSFTIYLLNINTL
jgi:hypothetical protein